MTQDNCAVLAPWQQCRDILLVFILLGTPVWVLFLRDWLGFEAWVPVGPVQAIHYFGTFGIKAQIDTPGRSFVVDGVTDLRSGQEVVLHVQRFGSELCPLNRQACETVRGHPQ